ncbi:MAG: hypothetical protein SV765_18065 [Pseudomonadota bacterium]|nr:hypothetical protein [Pseudomonadales bacterium]MDY6922108.1 hypothetical protein [Pseudomonadota bacterium]
MKVANVTVRRLAIDSLSFTAVLALTVGGFWGLFLVDASLFTMVVFGLLMVPALLSSTYYLGKDINEATHKLIA